MKKLQAAMRDSSAKAWRENRLYYKIGSVFKGCHHCGDVEIEETNSGEIKRYTSGFNVFRAYDPKWMKWTYWCWDCGAKDLQCWEGAFDIGQPAIRGTRDAVKERKYALRKQMIEKPERVHVPSRAEEIAALEDKLAKLMAVLKGGK